MHVSISDRIFFARHKIIGKKTIDAHTDVFELNKDGKTFVGLKRHFSGDVNYSIIDEVAARELIEAIADIIGKYDEIGPKNV